MEIVQALTAQNKKK